MNIISQSTQNGSQKKTGEYKTNFNEQDIANLEPKLESVEQNSLSQREMDGLLKDICDIYNYCREYWFLQRTNRYKVS